MLKELTDLKSRNTWVRQVDTEVGTFVYRSPTVKLGEWVELRIPKSDAPTLFSIKESGIQATEFKGETCEPVSRAVSKRSDPNRDLELFSDSTLKGLLGSKKSGIIYVWSPSMVYSTKFFGKLQKAAREAHLDFIPVVDKRTPRKVLAELQARHGHSFLKSKRLTSVELEMRNVEMHFPSSVVYSNGKLAPFNIIGVMQVPDFKREIDRDLKFLKLQPAL